MNDVLILFFANTVNIVQTVVPIPPILAHLVPNKHKPLALVEKHIPTGEPLVTPDDTDKIHKHMKACNRQSFAATKKRKNAVATGPDENGISAFTAELHIEQASAIRPVAAATSLPATTKSRKKKVSAPVVATIVSVPTGPPEKKCQGCIHGDVLEMNVMEPTDIKYYLQEAQFLELATCAGDCKKTIKEIYLASTKANLHYCNMTNKGFYAPDNDPAKTDLECGLILCLPCFALREERYAVANNNTGTGTRRNRRRA